MNNKAKNESIKFNEVKKIVNEVDPMGIIYGEENEDEYKHEIEQILKIYNSSIGKDDLTQEIYKIFIDYFNKDLVNDIKPYLIIADKLKQNKTINNVKSN